MFIKVVRELDNTTFISGQDLADILLEQQKLLPQTVDPLIPAYAETLLEEKRISTSDLLGALFKHSRQQANSKNEAESSDGSKATVSSSPAELEYQILDQLSKAYAPGGTRPSTQEEVRATLKVLGEWMSAVATEGDALLQPLDHQSVLMIDSLGMLGISMLENQKVIGVVEAAISKGLRKSLSHALTAFVPYWTHASPQHVQNATRLETGQRSRSLVDDTLNAESQEGTLDVAAALQLQAVVDLSIARCRPSIFAFINSLLVGCPLTDDSMMMGYLHVKYGSDIGTLAIDLTVAAFDILSSAVDRNESSQTLFALKSFLINKIPPLLSTLATSMFPPLTPQLCITQALQHVDLNIFPSFGMGMLTNSVLNEVRQEFIYGCILHGILPVDSVNQLLGETPFEPPPTPESKYHRDVLSQQCANEPGKAVQLIGELEKLDGNAGAIVGAVTETIRSACSTKETMSLKSMCNALSGKPQFLDVMMQFTSPASVLQPLCNLLDAWRFEDDQGEFQPVYDEFASIFLLVLAFVYRYQFSNTEMGISKDSFVAKYIVQGHQSLLAEELDDEQMKYLGSWIKGLYDPEGITEEVTGACRPQQFYMIVPTIFSQTMLVCAGGALDWDIVKNGLEYLHETFLLPSLVGAIYWMISCAGEQRGSDLTLLLQTIQRVTRAPSSPDAQPMHATILYIVAQPLTACLRSLQKQNPKRNDIESIISNLKPYVDFRRTSFTPCPELQTWRPQGGIRQNLKSVLQGLIIWGAGGGQQLSPPHYNPRLVLIAESVLGAPATLSVLLEEVKAQTEAPNGNAAVALDIATAFICAPKTENSPIHVGWQHSPVPVQATRGTKRLNLRDALKLEFDAATDLIQKDQTMAETVVRLHRAVEAQLNFSVAPMPDITGAAPMPSLLPMTGNNASVVDQGMAFGTDTNAAGMDLGDGGLDISGTLMGDMKMDGNEDDIFGGGHSMGGNENDDDVFGGLDFSNLEGMGDSDYYQ
ncbi:hypothetical protein EG328_001548 [Venturia inaequalis]|uniref:Mediator of RNA polymerase II transcription subunit 5 n=1 Tax=Venturia inaequalis TaxID=5025 RepID=A0A8H3VQ07_VENIN|nr:hypothetical protein EG328_001548 [Venturia inaequalis]KAE9990873.1 hypothetical protein EG327_000807 [Venturia inaequalis]